MFGCYSFANVLDKTTSGQTNAQVAALKEARSDMQMTNAFHYSPKNKNDQRHSNREEYELIYTPLVDLMHVIIRSTFLKHLFTSSTQIYQSALGEQKNNLLNHDRK